MSIKIVLALVILLSCASSAIVTFSGRTWYVRAKNDVRQGPGPNFFDNDTTSVWVDSNSHLHLKIQKNTAGDWTCSGVFLGGSLGYGSYVFALDKGYEDIDPVAVIGMFIYQDDTHEIDVEVSQWGRLNRPNLQYVTQPYKIMGNMDRFTMKNHDKHVVHAFTWSSTEIFYQTFFADSIADVESEIGKPSSSPNKFREWTYTGTYIPQPGKEKTVLNFWLTSGKAPLNDMPQEIIFREFKHIP